MTVWDLMSDTNDQGYKYLDFLAQTAETDKSSSFHNYTEIYARYFDNLKNQPIRFLEIGIYKGASVKLWEDYFPNAELHFIDITPRHIKYKSERSQYYFLNQADGEAVKALMEKIGGEWDIVIDDGGHTMHQQVNSFKAIFPFLKSKGLYFIEDLHTSYHRHYGGTPPGQPLLEPNTLQYLFKLVDDLNYRGIVTDAGNNPLDKIPEDITKDWNIYQKELYSICFHSCLAVITKR
jgi:hypothetical protein